MKMNPLSLASVMPVSTVSVSATAGLDRSNASYDSSSGLSLRLIAGLTHGSLRVQQTLVPFLRFLSSFDTPRRHQTVDNRLIRIINIVEKLIRLLMNAVTPKVFKSNYTFFMHIWNLFAV
ncbi:hypothetical protein [Geomicrobium sp. JCM 19037]|uniref:hypothetical protein n=1 Tax=Geomicrobium sp. JCM 19037 TaxID=1460634 RepID=UPI001EE67444|nr:hypothetical protein [Geomicrobium sp. JCM 19037]